MYIGMLAKLTDTTPKTIRHYESIGLMPVPARKGRYRIYTEQDVRLLKMIRQAQTVGFSLSELKELAAEKHKTGQFPHTMANELFALKHTQFQQKIEEIEKLMESLTKLKKDLNTLYG